jgi:hypothetical protein
LEVEVEAGRQRDVLHKKGGCLAPVIEIGPSYQEMIPAVGGRFLGSEGLNEGEIFPE